MNRFKGLLALGSGLALQLFALPAVADSAAREHDRFYLRAGAGVPFAFGKNQVDGGSEADVSSVGFATELALGGTLAPGLVVGGGVYSLILPSPKYEADGTESKLGTHHMGNVGPFVDYYLDPKQGLHAQAALLLSFTVVDEKDPFGGASGGGFGAMLGVGYELWIGAEWSVGPLFRFTYSRVNLKGNDSDAEATLSLFAPTLLVAFTYH